MKKPVMNYVWTCPTCKRVTYLSDDDFVDGRKGWRGESCRCKVRGDTADTVDDRVLLVWGDVPG